MLPAFIKLSVAEKVLVIGKSINFIRVCALRVDPKSSTSRSQRAETGRNRESEDALPSKGLEDYITEHFDPDTVSALEALRYGDEERLETVVTRLSTVIDRKLLTLMTDRFELPRHLLALKKFILLGQVN